MDHKSPARPAERDAGELQPAIPVRMLNEYTYCPRLAYLEWVQGEWAGNADTVQGDHAHRRVDGKTKPLPKRRTPDAAIHGRSMHLGSDRLGIVAKVDLVEEGAAGEAIPVEYKKGKRPHVDKGAFLPERVQVCAQAMLLEDHGHNVPYGVIYFAGSKERVRVDLDDALRSAVVDAVLGIRDVADRGVMPPPLEDSPKCDRCSLVAICLPDETRFVQDGGAAPRPIAVADPATRPVYVQTNGARVSKKGDTLEVHKDDDLLAAVPLADISHLVLQGNVYITTPAHHELLRRGVPLSWHSYSGYFLGQSQGALHKNVELRTAQYAASFDDQACVDLARGWVASKLRNSRTLLRRNGKNSATAKVVSKQLKELAKRAQRATSIDKLLGFEGAGAAAYFPELGALLAEKNGGQWVFEKRTRRPPRDPVNAVLSFLYALLERAVSVALTNVGFDPFRGYFHQPRYGRPSLALDMMEPFRPLLADSTALTLFNNGELAQGDFVHADGAVMLNAEGRRACIQGFERRLEQEVTHPLFGYRVTYRRVLELQARLLGRYLLGDIDEYTNLVTR